MPRTNTRPQLRHQITLHTEGQATNALGEALSGWTEGDTVWADIEPLNGSELYRAQRLGQVTSHKVTIRWRPNPPKTNDRIGWGSKWLVVETVTDPDTNREWLEIMTNDREEGAPA